MGDYMAEPMTTFTASLISAVMMGLSCGTGCSPSIGTFLSTYVLHAEGDTKQSIYAFLSFFAGKAGAVILVCLIASLTGNAIVESGGYFGKFDIAFLMPAFLILSGGYLIRCCINDFRYAKCNSCGGCCGGKRNIQYIQELTPMIGGFLYGLTPCAPLILMAGQSVSLPLFQSLLLSAVFSMACTFSPLILMLCFMKLIASKMIYEVPKLFGMIKFCMSIVVFAIGVVSLVEILI